MNAVAELTRELHETICLLCELSPAFPAGKQQGKSQTSLRRKLAGYFRAIGRGLPRAKIAKFYVSHLHVATESAHVLLEKSRTVIKLETEAAQLFSEFVEGHDVLMTRVLEKDLKDVYTEGANGTLRQFVKAHGVKGAVFMQPRDPAVGKWFEKYSFELIKSLDEETKRRLGKALADAIMEQRGIPGATRAVREVAEGMEKWRAERIARTEVKRGLNRGALDRAISIGGKQKEWITVGDDRVSPECESNEGEGRIPIGDSFSGGTHEPPQHANCRCAMATFGVDIKKLRSVAA